MKLLLPALATLFCLPAFAEPTAIAKKRPLYTKTMEKIRTRMASRHAEAAMSPFLVADHMQVEFVIQPQDCSLLKSPVKGAGIYTITLLVSMNEDGTYHFVEKDESSGPASDDTGNSYIYLYNLKLEWDGPAPEPSYPLTATGPDSFQLIPAEGSAGGYLLTILFKASLTGPNLAGDFIPLVASGPVGCDPI